MRWRNVWTIFKREVRDQARDGRTLFMIFVLPILLYPILGITIVKLSETVATKQRLVVVIGAEHLPKSPPLLDPEAERFAGELFTLESDRDHMVAKIAEDRSPWLDPDKRKQMLRDGDADAVLVIPPDAKRTIESQGAIKPTIAFNSSNERSQGTYLRLREILREWSERIVSNRLAKEHKPESFTEPVKTTAGDVANVSRAGRGEWARIFPFLLVIMSLTGAFYPAIDLCAGEKERGTMETLLISPAGRSEIVLGKFFTVLLASMITAILNLASMSLTGLLLVQRAMLPMRGPSAEGAAAGAATLAPPSLASMFWMVILLIPLAAFFSALCVALAVMAKSMKEGQYYMTPLYMVALPLIFLTLAPETTLDGFYSLVPITGVSLLLRTLLQGDFLLARKYFLAVLVPTMIYGVLALRWAVDQFLKEDVLFRSAERFDLKGWLGYLLKQKRTTPTGGEALLCFALMLCSAWFLVQLLADQSPRGMVVAQMAFVLTPPLAMAFLLTSSPRTTLRIHWPRTEYLLLACGLALALHPLGLEFGAWVEWNFPVPDEIKKRLAQMMSQVPNTFTLVVLFAVIPAICEEVAFRGFILSGLLGAYRPITAVVLSALLFGFMHVLLSLSQQAFNSILLGLLLGVFAFKSRSLLPGIVFHLLTNGLAVLAGQWSESSRSSRISEWLFRDRSSHLYHWYWLLLGAIAGAILIGRLARIPADVQAKPSAGDHDLA